MSRIEFAKRQLLQAASWLWEREPIVLVVVLVLIAGSWAFVQIADEVIEGDTTTFDEAVVRAMRRADDPAVPVGPAWLEEAGRDVTALGGVPWLLFFTFAIAGYLWLDRKGRMALYLLAATGSGLLVSLLLKEIFQRPRPQVVPHLAHVMTSSFPSGHSMMSAVVYVTLGAILAAAVRRRALKVYVLAISLLLTFSVGLSRIYLGVHYPTDVAAGWIVGILWALGAWLIARWLQRRGDVEPAKRTEGETATGA